MNRTNTFHKQLFIFFFILAICSNDMLAQCDLKITITDIHGEKGQILYSLYKQETGFPDDSEKAFRRGSIPVSTSQINHVITNIPPGYYAISLIHDVNGNNRLDKNKMGIPTEGFAFSNNAMGAFGPPKYIRARFAVNSDSANTQRIRLRKMQ